MKKRLSVIILSLLLAVMLVVPAIASDNLVYDNAGLLYTGETEALNEILCTYSQLRGIDIAVLTADDTGGYDTQTYTDLFANENLSSDNILLCINMGDREWHISTAGTCINIYSDSILEYMGEQIVPYLSDGDYNTAFNEFASLANDYAEAYATGDYGDIDIDPVITHQRTLSDYLPRILMGLAVGVGAGFIGKGVLKSQLKSVHAQDSANSYVRKNSLNLTKQQDIYLYSTVSRVAKPKNTSSGSSTHSTGGVSHGGRGGSF